jgi:hypothetical protein
MKNHFYKQESLNERVRLYHISERQVLNVARAAGVIPGFVTGTIIAAGMVGWIKAEGGSATEYAVAALSGIAIGIFLCCWLFAVCVRWFIRMFNEGGRENGGVVVRIRDLTEEEKTDPSNLS